MRLYAVPWRLGIALFAVRGKSLRNGHRLVPREVCDRGRAVRQLIAVGRHVCRRRLNAASVTSENWVTRPEVAIRVLVMKPDQPTGAVMLLPGGHGNINLDAQAHIGWGEDDFLIRTRSVMPTADRLRSFRTSPPTISRRSRSRAFGPRRCRPTICARSPTTCAA